MLTEVKLKTGYPDGGRAPPERRVVTNAYLILTVRPCFLTQTNSFSVETRAHLIFYNMKENVKIPIFGYALTDADGNAVFACRSRRLFSQACEFRRREIRNGALFVNEHYEIRQDELTRFNRNGARNQGE